MQTRKEHEALMCEANGDARYISTKCSVWIDSLYFECEKLFPMLGKYFPDFSDEILTCDNQTSASANGEFTTSFRHSHTNIERTQRSPSPRFMQPRNRG